MKAHNDPKFINAFTKYVKNDTPKMWRYYLNQQEQANEVHILHTNIHKIYTIFYCLKLKFVKISSYNYRKSCNEERLHLTGNNAQKLLTIITNNLQN